MKQNDAPPSVCEEWWRQVENFVKTRRKVQPRFGLGYCNTEASDDEDEHFNVNQVHFVTLTVSWGDEVGCSHYASANDNAWRQELSRWMRSRTLYQHINNLKMEVSQ